jgi:hypothetical protein
LHVLVAKATQMTLRKLEKYWKMMYGFAFREGNAARTICTT